jgi:hypothetical protein
MHDLNIAVIGLGQAANILADALYRFFVPNNSIAKGAG